MPDPRTENADWTELETLWSGDEASDPARDSRLDRLRERVKRRAARRRLWHTIEVLSVLSVVVLVAVLAIERKTAAGWTALAYTVAVATGGLGFGLWNRRRRSERDLDTPADALVAARTDLRIQRRTLRFGWLLLTLHAAFFTVWIPLTVEAPPAASTMDGPPAILGRFAFLALWLLAFTVPMFVLDARSRREEAEIASLERELESSPP